MTAVNVTIVDYNNNKAGFIFDVDCQTALSDDAKTGEILFDSIKFKVENSTASKIREDSFIRFNGHQNFTLQNSFLYLHYNFYEETNTFDLSDDISWAASDNLSQNIIIQNNMISFDVVEADIYNNFAINYFGNGVRNIYTYIQGNSFINMLNSYNSLIDIEYYTTGDEIVNNNIFSNWSSNSDLSLVHIYDDTQLTFDSNTFVNWVSLISGFLHSEGSTGIVISNLIVTNTTHGGTKDSGSIILIDVSILFKNFNTVLHYEL